MYFHSTLYEWTDIHVIVLIVVTSLAKQKMEWALKSISLVLSCTPWKRLSPIHPELALQCVPWVFRTQKWSNKGLMDSKSIIGCPNDRVKMRENCTIFIFFKKATRVGLFQGVNPKKWTGKTNCTSFCFLSKLVTYYKKKHAHGWNSWAEKTPTSYSSCVLWFMQGKRIRPSPSSWQSCPSQSTSGQHVSKAHQYLARRASPFIQSLSKWYNKPGWPCHLHI